MMVAVSSDLGDETTMRSNPMTKKKKKHPHSGSRLRHGVLVSLLPSFLLPLPPQPPPPNSSIPEPQTKQQQQPQQVPVSSSHRLLTPAAPEAEPETKRELQCRASLEQEPGASGEESIDGDGFSESTGTVVGGGSEGWGGERSFGNGGSTVSPASGVDSTAPTEGQQRAAVTRLLFGFGPPEERAAAAADVGRIASAGGHPAKKSLASLGVIPCLVDMLCRSGTASAAAARALIQLADGTYSNKVAMVEAGVIPKLAKALESNDYCQQTTDDDNLFALLRTVTSLAKASQPAHQLPPSTCATLLPALVRAITTTTTTSTSSRHQSALSALLNLSSHLPNARLIVSQGFIPPLLLICSPDRNDDYTDAPAARRNQQLAALAVLGNLVVTPAGAAAVDREEDLAPACIVTLLKTAAAAGDTDLQDRALRLLASLARTSGRQKKRMAEVGVVKVLVEVTLLSDGVAARRRAAEMIGWFKRPEYCAWAPLIVPPVERYRGPTIRPQDRGDADDDVAGSVVSTSGKLPTPASTAHHHRDDIRRMVRQSLDRNMDSIVRRANGTPSATTARTTSCLAHFSRQHRSPSLNQDSVGNASSKSLPS